MPIVSNRTNLNNLQYVVNSSAGNYNPVDDRGNRIAVSTPVSQAPFVTVPIPGIKDPLPGIGNFRVSNGAGINSANLSTIQSDIRRIITDPSILPSISSGFISDLNTPVTYSNNFIRGGILGVQQAIIRDFSRVNSFINSTGGVFRIKQQSLQKSNVLFEGKGEQKTTYNTTGRSILEYDVRNTVNQTLGTALGSHYLRHGSNINIFSNPDNTTQETYYNHARANAQFVDGGGDVLKTNRLLSLYNSDKIQLQSDSKTLGNAVNIVRSTALPPANSIISNSNPTFFGGILNGIRGGTSITTLNNIRQQAENAIINAENNIRSIVERSPLGSVVISSLQALGVNTNRNLISLGGLGLLGSSTRPSINLRDNEILYEYNGGPNSVYGSGKTTIRRYSFTGDPDKIEKSREISSQKAGKATYNEKGDVQEITYIEPGGSGSILTRALGEGEKAISTYPGMITDVSEISRAIGQSPLGSTRTYADVFNAINAPKQATFNKFGIFNSVIDKVTGFNGGNYSSEEGDKIEYKNSGYGEKVVLNYRNWNKVSREQRVGSGRQDSINLTPLFTSDAGFNALQVKIDNNIYTINDLAKFKIEGIHTDNPSKSTNMVFRAYITNYSDNVNAEWNDITYVGRGDKFHVYKGFTRTISVGFRVAALSAQEMKPMYQKLNNLMGNLLPDYSSGGLMRGPLVRMTIGNWIDSQPGIFTSLDYSISEETPWEIALNEPTPGGSKEMVLPHIVEVKLNFTPIGAQTKKVNKIMDKATKNQHTSYIAQNYNGDTPGEPNYIDGSNILVATPYTPPPPAAAPTFSGVPSGTPLANAGAASQATFGSLIAPQPQSSFGIPLASGNTSGTNSNPINTSRPQVGGGLFSF